MILQAGDLVVEIDTGTNEPGQILQRLEAGDWKDFQIEGEPVFSPADINTLPSGEVTVATRGNEIGSRSPCHLLLPRGRTCPSTFSGRSSLWSRQLPSGDRSFLWTPQEESRPSG